MRHLVSVIALALCACGTGENIVADGAASAVDARGSTHAVNSINSSTSTNVTNSVNSSSSSTVRQNSSNVGSTTITNSTNNGTSTCSTEHNGRRCEIACRSPRVAQCLKPANAVAPQCTCK